MTLIDTSVLMDLQIGALICKSYTGTAHKLHLDKKSPF